MIGKTILPALGVGALSGLASSGVQKAMGSDLYLKKGGCVCQVETDGSGLSLKPWVPRGSVVKCLTRNPGVLGSSRTGSSRFLRGSVLGQDTSEPSLVLVKPRKA